MLFGVTDPVCFRVYDAKWERSGEAALVIRVKASVFSVTPHAEPDGGAYLRWHLLDHMPEQYQLPGVVLAHRWIADGDYPASRIAGDGPLVELGNVVNYLMGDPVQQTFDDFMELGPRLAEIGRFPVQRPPLQVRLLALHQWYAAPRVLVSPEVVPFRPHRGVCLLFEEPVGDRAERGAWLQWLHAEHHPAVLEVPGVAGAWMYGSTRTWTPHPATEGPPQYATVVYLDDDPLGATKALTPLLEQRWASGAVRPLFAGPLRTMIDWEAWPSGAGAA